MTMEAAWPFAVLAPWMPSICRKRSSSAAKAGVALRAADRGALAGRERLCLGFARFDEADAREADGGEQREGDGAEVLERHAGSSLMAGRGVLQGPAAQSARPIDTGSSIVSGSRFHIPSE